MSLAFFSDSATRAIPKKMQQTGLIQHTYILLKVSQILHIHFQTSTLPNGLKERPLRINFQLQ